MGASFLAKLGIGNGVMMRWGNWIVLTFCFAASDAFNGDCFFYGEDTALARCLGKLGEVKFSFALRAYSSGRRLAAEGVLKVGSRYFVNYLSTMMLNRPFTETWLDFRPTNAENKGIAKLPPHSLAA